MPVPLWLDHASVAVPNLAAAVEHLDRRLGLRATVSPAAPERHSRVYLHRSYLEVSAGSAGSGWEATMCFLRFDDPDALRAHLDEAGISYSFGEYEGVDGTWDDVEIRIGAVPLPTLIRRTAPVEVARDWPPALAGSHRSGARILAEVHVEVPSVDEAVEAYRVLLGRWQRVSLATGPARVALSSGDLVLHEGGSGGIVGIVLGVASLAATSLAATRAELRDRLGRDGSDTVWLDAVETFGLRLGFTEVRGITPA